MQPHKAPDPVFATWEQATNTLVITFDQPLLHLPTTVTNYWVFDGIIRHFGGVGFGQAFKKTVTVELTQGFPLVAPPQAVYFAGPADVIGRSGLPVAAFSGFPVTFI